MGRVKRPLSIVYLPDVPDEAVRLLDAQGHCTHPLERIGQLTHIDAVVGAKCWRILEAWWVKDGKLSPYAKVMLKSVTAVTYPDKGKKGKPA